MTALSSDALAELAPSVRVPGYDRRRVSVGIVHVGPGAFHRSHQAMYLDDYLAQGDPGWGICTVGLLPGDTAIRDVLARQDNLYTLLETDPQGVESARVVGSIVRHLHAPDDLVAVLDVLKAPTTRILTLTITEGGYEADSPLRLAGVENHINVFDVIVEALSARRGVGTPPFAVLSCDNVQENGRVAREAVAAAARRRDPELAEWISSSVDFPNSMVDRITPVTTDATRARALALGVEDEWPVAAESFAQWVIEDQFAGGRPELERVGVQFVGDVRPYEKLKLRLLNASHQALAYLGLLSGATLVHEVCRSPDFVAFLRAYMREEAEPTLDAVPGVSVRSYGETVLERFGSAATPDTLARQVVDGSDRIAKFLVPVLADQLTADRDVRRCALVLAAWAQFLSGATRVEPLDRRLPELKQLVAHDELDPGVLLDYEPVFGDLGSDPRLRSAYRTAKSTLLQLGPRGAIARLG